MKKTGKKLPAGRTTFRHGNLREALLNAAIDLAREGGPTAVVLREATRRAGVSPNAAYRHFENHEALLHAVRATALATLARMIEIEMVQAKRIRKPAESARAALRAVGTGYLKFALGETGLFRAAFSVREPVANDHDPEKQGDSGLNPFELLSSALDQMTQAGVLPKSRRPHAEYLAWSAVHGMAYLVIDGPLNAASPKDVEHLAERLLLMVEKGL
ncbi:TetR/AcrR family transcriptional regulator [Silvibacterium acidisoli]|uniref:TetR/AcrR family transcriptional regulator n=1 Tax=Acidobacteriaceae bacterium ZG23-2 TaxID=2883246 RepID=UPI00406C6194